MKRALFLLAAVTFTVTTAAPLTVRACQYCRMALEDPEGGRMITDNRGGSFPLDASLSQYQAAPVSADLKVAPAADSVATSASALAAAAPVVVHRPVLPPPAVVVKKDPVPVVAVKKDAAPAATINSVIAHWTDACLLGLVAVGGVFCWRTRRPAA